MTTSCGCEPTFTGEDPGFKRIMWLIIFLNGGMFVVEWFYGIAADSRALHADALDFLGDSVTYALTLFVIGSALRTRALVSLLKGVSLGLMAGWVIYSTIYGVLYSAAPDSPTIGIVGLCALTVNLISVVLLLNYREGDANIRSVWLCSRNDAIGNVLVIIAAVGVWKANSAWPDLLVAGILASLFFHSAAQIVKQALNDYRHASIHDAAELQTLQK